MPATGARSGGQEATGELPRSARKKRARARAAGSKGAAAEGYRAQAADGGTQGRGPGRDQGTGRARRGAGRAPRCVGDRGRDPRHGQRAGRRPKGKGKGATGPKGQTGRGMRARGGGGAKGRGAGGRAAPQPDVQPVRCIRPGIQQMPAHHTHHYHHHHHHLYNIDPGAGELVPPKPPRPKHQPAPPAPRAEPARMASAGGKAGRGIGAAGTGATGGAGARVEGAWPWDRDWGTVPDPLGEEALPLVGEVYGWLCWANQGTTRGLRNGPFDAVLLRRDRGNREVPPGGWAAPEDHERVLRSVIRWRGPTGSRRGRPSWKGERYSASRMWTPTNGSPGPCAAPSPTGATAGATRRRHNPSPHTSGGAGDGPDGGREKVGGGAGPPAPRPPNGTA